MPSIIRYPGAKTKLAHDIRHSLPDWLRTETHYRCIPGDAWFVEPFFGSGAVGLAVLRHIVPRTNGPTISGRRDKPVGVWINDADYAMYALWTSIVHHTEHLVSMVHEFQPSKEAFYELKKLDGTQGHCIATDGFNKIALHRMSMSGWGRMAGGPIGGKKQGGQYTVGCRWNPAPIAQAIYDAKIWLTRFRETRITNLHFRDVIAACGSSAVIYLDPPYYVKGGQLYAHNMTHDEHAELATLLRATPADWRLSYDDCPEIRDLYSWASFKELEIRYTNAITDKKRPKNRELLISPQEVSCGR